MNIKVIREEQPIHLTGGEYALSEVTISVSPKLEPREQTEVVIHSVIEVYNCSWTHDKVEELTSLVMEALDQLNE